MLYLDFHHNYQPTAFICLSIYVSTEVPVHVTKAVCIKWVVQIQCWNIHLSYSLFISITIFMFLAFAKVLTKTSYFVWFISTIHIFIYFLDLVPQSQRGKEDTVPCSTNDCLWFWTIFSMISSMCSHFPIRPHFCIPEDFLDKYVIYNSNYSLQKMYSMRYKNEYMVLQRWKCASSESDSFFLGNWYNFASKRRTNWMRWFLERVSQCLYNNIHTKEIRRKLCPERNQVQPWQTSLGRRIRRDVYTSEKVSDRLKKSRYSTR